MILIAISIVVLVLCSKYRQRPTKNMRTGLTVTTIITTVLSFFELTSIIALGVFKGFIDSNEFYDMIQSAIMRGELDIEDFATATEAVDFAISITAAFIVVGMIICTIIMAFGIVAAVFGFKTIADKSIVIVDTNVQQNGCNYNYNNGYNTDYQNSNQAYTQQNYNPAPNTQPIGEWYCVCGIKNQAGQKFCSNCGSKNPNIN